MIRERRRLYAVWYAMRGRCGNPLHKDFSDYGGRGITVCDRWSSFDVFAKDMGERPMRASIERINNDGDYEPSNCRWASTQEQKANTRRTIRVMVNGEQMSLKEACNLRMLPYDTIRVRISSLGWDTERALSQPIMYMPRLLVQQSNGGQVSLREACRLSGMPYSTALKRVRAGWSMERTLTVPIRSKAELQ